MIDLIFNKNDSFFFEKKTASSWGAPQENDVKFRFAIHPQGIRQFLDKRCCSYMLIRQSLLYLHMTKSL